MEKVTAKLLDVLCDLQAITGMAIATAGLAQMPEISFYHEEFVVLFWELTCISFWAARSNYMQSTNEGIRAVLRKLTVLSSVVLYLVFASLVVQRETSMWDPIASGRCYLANDPSGRENAIFWICGAAVYAFVLALDLAQDVAHFFAARFFKRAIPDFVRDANNYVTSRPRALLSASGTAKHLVVRVLGYFFAGLLWIFINCLAVWSYGNCFYPFEILCSIGLAAWNTYNIVDLKIMNRDLVTGSEADWGFGQVLPTAMLLFIAYSTVDALRGMLLAGPVSQTTQEKNAAHNSAEVLGGENEADEPWPKLSRTAIVRKKVE